MSSTLLVTTWAWSGIAGQDAPWVAGFRIELLDEGDETRIQVREMMLPKLGSAAGA